MVKVWHSANLLRCMLVSFAVNAILTYPMGPRDIWFLNDGALHLHHVRMMQWAVTHHLPLWDFWDPVINGGHPFARTYPWLLHGLVYGQSLVFSTISLSHIYEMTLWMLWVCFPLTLFQGMKLMGFSNQHALWSVTLAPWLATSFRFGISWETYDWLGPGLGPNLLGVVCFPLALGYSIHFLKCRSGLAMALFWMTATWFAHLMTGYMAGLTLAVFAMIWNVQSFNCGLILRTAILAGLMTICLLPVIEPFVTQGQNLNKTAREPIAYWDSHGLPEVVRSLFKGDIFDHQHLGILTAFLLLSFGVTWNKHRWLVIACVFWFLAFCGRFWWNPVAYLLPVDEKIAYERFVVAFQLVGLIIMGASHAWFTHRERLRCLLLCVIMVVPAYQLLQRQWIETQDVKQQTYQAQTLIEVLWKDRFEQLKSQLEGRHLWVPPQRDLHVFGMPFYQFPLQYDIPHLGNLWHTMAPISDGIYDIDINDSDDLESYGIHYGLHPPRPISDFWIALETTPAYQWSKTHQPNAPIRLLGKPSSARMKGWTQWIQDGQFGYKLRLQTHEPILIQGTFSYHPHWVVTTAETTIPTASSPQGFLVFRLPKGEHDIRLTYKPSYWAPILWLLSASVFCTAIFAPIWIKPTG